MLYSSRASWRTSVETEHELRRNWDIHECQNRHAAEICFAETSPNPPYSVDMLARHHWLRTSWGWAATPLGDAKLRNREAGCSWFWTRKTARNRAVWGSYTFEGNDSGLGTDGSPDEGKSKAGQEVRRENARWQGSGYHHVLGCGLGRIDSPSLQCLAASPAALNRQQPANQMLHHCEGLASFGCTRPNETNGQGDKRLGEYGKTYSGQFNGLTKRFPHRRETYRYPRGKFKGWLSAVISFCNKDIREYNELRSPLRGPLTFLEAKTRADKTFQTCSLHLQGRAI